MASAYTLTNEQAPSYWNADILWSILADGEKTNGDYALIWELCPKNSGPSPHYHDQDESFYIISGAVTFILDGERMTGSDGTFVHIPKGTVHSFRIDSEKAEILNSYVPAGFEKTIKLGEKAQKHTLPPKGRPMKASKEETLDLFKKVGMHIVDSPDVLRDELKDK